ncbi:MAG: type II secretion system protein GspD, partial [Coraliomargarita sp.]
RDWSRERSKTIDSQNNSETGVDFDSGAAPQLTNTQVTEVIEDVTRLASTARSDTAVFNADQFRVVLSALETMNDSKLVTNPTVVVMNKREANFEVGRDYPIRDLTFNQETGTYEAGGVEEKFIGINLKVTPEVLGGNIHLAVDPTVSALDGVVESFGAIDPIIARRSVQTEVVIKDGFTLALGGLMDEQVNDTGTKVPVLGSLPGVGR